MENNIETRIWAIEIGIFLTLSQPKPGQILSLLAGGGQTSGVLERHSITFIESMLPDWLHQVKGASDGSSEACIDLVRS